MAITNAINVHAAVVAAVDAMEKHTLGLHVVHAEELVQALGGSVEHFNRLSRMSNGPIMGPLYLNLLTARAILETTK